MGVHMGADKSLLGQVVGWVKTWQPYVTVTLTWDNDNNGNNDHDENEQDKTIPMTTPPSTYHLRWSRWEWAR